MLASFPRASPDVEEAAAAAGFFLKNVMAYHPFSSFTFGLQIAGTFTGAIITEGIFSWPGMGTMINTAINNCDYSLILGAVLFSAIMFVFCNMLVDIAYAILNPKVKLEKG